MREIEVALVAWSKEERALEDAAPDSLEYAEAQAEVMRLRNAYRALVASETASPGETDPPNANPALA